MKYGHILLKTSLNLLLAVIQFFYLNEIRMKVKFFITALALFFVISAQSQDDSSIVSDEELQRYAVMMDSIEAMRQTLLAEISEMVKSNEKITVARYNELSKIMKDESKLEAAQATPDEITALKEVQARKDSGTVEINDVFKSVAKEYVGAATYNKVKKALNEDAEVKSKYQVMLNKLKEDNGG